MIVKLLVLEGIHKGRELPLPETIYMIGRDKQCHLRPHCQQVSQLHCAIAAWAGQVRVRDLKSKNGTFLNGKAINGEVLVHDGDRLQIGSLVFLFRITSDTGNPVAEPIRDAREVQWLMNEVEESDVLSPLSQTWLVENAAEMIDNAQAKSAKKKPGSPNSKTNGSKALSAGQHLRDYLDARKHQR